MDTSTRIPTGSKRKRNISQLSALFHCFPRNDLLITYKTLPGLSRATFLFSTHSWKLLFSHPIDRVQKAMGLSVSWITFISFYKSPYYYYYMSLYMGFFLFFLFSSSFLIPLSRWEPRLKYIFTLFVCHCVCKGTKKAASLSERCSICQALRFCADWDQFKTAKWGTFISRGCPPCFVCTLLWVW